MYILGGFDGRRLNDMCLSSFCISAVVNGQRLVRMHTFVQNCSHFDTILCLNLKLWALTQRHFNNACFNHVLVSFNSKFGHDSSTNPSNCKFDLPFSFCPLLRPARYRLLLRTKTELQRSQARLTDGVRSLEEFEPIAKTACQKPTNRRC